MCFAAEPFDLSVASGAVFLKPIVLAGLVTGLVIFSAFFVCETALHVFVAVFDAPRNPAPPGTADRTSSPAAVTDGAVTI